MIILLGWLGTLFFALCGVPQAYKCFRQGNAYGISKIFIFMWLIGEICYIIATWISFGFVFWLMINYFCNVLFILIIIYYMICPKKI